MTAHAPFLYRAVFCGLLLLVCTNAQKYQHQHQHQPRHGEYDPAMRPPPTFQFSDGAEALLKATEDRCMESAVAELTGKCSSLRADGDEKAKLALRIANCFFERTGRRTQLCPTQRSARDCIAALDAEAYGVYSSFFLQADALCYRVRERAFQEASAEAINGLYAATHQSAATVMQVLRRSEKMNESLGMMRASLDANFEGLTKHAAATTALVRETNSLARATADSLSEVKEKQSSIKESLIMMEGLFNDSLSFSASFFLAPPHACPCSFFLQFSPFPPFVFDVSFFLVLMHLLYQ